MVNVGEYLPGRPCLLCPHQHPAVQETRLLPGKHRRHEHGWPEEGSVWLEVRIREGIPDGWTHPLPWGSSGSWRPFIALGRHTGVAESGLHGKNTHRWVFEVLRGLGTFGPDLPGKPSAPRSPLGPCGDEVVEGPEMKPEAFRRPTGTGQRPAGQRLYIVVSIVFMVCSFRHKTHIV